MSSFIGLNSMENSLSQAIEIAQALCRLLGPQVEAVVHDLSTEKIVFIEGFLSKRRVGDPSLLDEDLQFESELTRSVYSKLNFDGRLLKSISIPIKEKGKIIALLCINYDVTFFQELNKLTDIILGKPLLKKPEALFKNDWQDRINEFIHQFLKVSNLQFSSLTNKDKSKIVHMLYKQGAFCEKNASDYIARALQISRATVFNYLRKSKVLNHEA